jgi:5,10-methylenetetrahydromethanopterin reductase
VTHFGIQLHGTFPMRRYPALAQAVESHGVFGELTVHDIVWWRPVWPILTLVAASTERVAVGPDVTHPYLRHPADTAANLAALDELSGGRAILGLGAGSLLEPLGIRSARPVTAVRECAELVQRLLARDREPYEGELFRAGPEAVFNWQPPRARVPTFVGAFGPRMVESAAAWADEIRPPGQWAVPFFAELKARAERAAEAAGNERLRVGCDVWLSLDDDRDAARRLGRRLLAQFVPALAAMHEFHGIGPDEVEPVAERLRAGDHKGAAAAVSDRLLDTYVGAGDPDDVRAGVERLVEAGASTITFSGRLGPEPERALELLATRVLPELSTTTEEEIDVRLP